MTLDGVLLDRLTALGVERGASVGVAVSGGGDSTALLYLLVRIAPRLDLRLHVLHVDHSLRAGSADDARAVAVLAEGLGVPCTLLNVRVADRPGSSVEAAARRVRYAALASAASELGCDVVATAHTCDDQAETVLLRVLRGTSPGGLAGIAPRRGPFIRPLLFARRAQLRSWLRERGLSWRDEETNLDERFERNWLRASVLPVLETRRPAVVDVLARLADHARDDAAALDQLARDLSASVRRPAPGWIEIPRETLAGHHAIATRVILFALRDAGARADAATVRAVLDVARARGASTVVCGGGVTACRTARGIALVSARPAPRDVRLPDDGVTQADEWGVRVRVSSGRDADAWAWRCTLDAASGELTLRRRRPGDRVRTPGGTRKVQDVLVDAKVPRAARDRIPVLCVRGTPVAVVGLTSPVVAVSGHVRVVDAESLEDDWWSRATP